MRALIIFVLFQFSCFCFGENRDCKQKNNPISIYDSRPDCKEEEKIGIGITSIRLYFVEYMEKEKYRAPFISEIRLFDKSGKKVQVKSVTSSTGDKRRNSILESKGAWYPDRGDLSPWIELNIGVLTDVSRIEYVQNLQAYCLIDCTPRPNDSSLVRGTPSTVRIETSTGSQEFNVGVKTNVTIAID